MIFQIVLNWLKQTIKPPQTFEANIGIVHKY